MLSAVLNVLFYVAMAGLGLAFVTRFRPEPFLRSRRRLSVVLALLVLADAWPCAATSAPWGCARKGARSEGSSG